jgi:hypothetical protein
MCTQLTPGGDFCWLRRSYTWDGGASPGAGHGHSVVARDFGYTADETFKAAPGGSYSSAALSCISCHDPHGAYRRLADGSIGTSGPSVVASGSYSTSPDPTPAGPVGTYRLLAGKNYLPRTVPGAVAFTSDPPAAVSPPSYNRSEATHDTRVAYGSGMSQWCMNCHPGVNASNMHPSGSRGTLSADVIATYDAYVASGRRNGSATMAYSSLVPFEMGTADYSVLKRTANADGSVRSGPGSGAAVTCLTCHRAHASPWDHGLRWNFRATFLVYGNAYPGIDNGAPAEDAQGRTAAEAQKAFYDRPASAYSAFQRSLCNKCHGED